MIRTFSSFFFFLLVLLTVFSYLFIDANLPFFNTFYTGFVTRFRSITAVMYALFIITISGFYLFLIAKRKVLSLEKLKRLIITSSVVLLFAYPAMLSYDIFNYITTAKVIFFYHENPYITMPIEFLGDPNLAFTRAANKIALYGPAWIVFSGIPYLLGLQNLILTVFSFKICILLFYMATVYLLWKMTKNSFSVLLFALNPLVLIETLVSAHNDIVMVFFALLALFLAKHNKLRFGILSLIMSILIKYATVVLLPLFFYVAYTKKQKKKVDWEKVYAIAVVVMFVPFLAAPLREEIYPWYVIWLLAFAVLIPKKTYLLSFVVALSFSSLLRYLPVLYTGSYFGATPIVKELLTFVPLVAFTIFWIWKNMLWQKYSR